MVELLVNSGYHDQTPRSAASDQGLHCLPVTFLGVSRFLGVSSFQQVNSEKNELTRYK